MKPQLEAIPGKRADHRIVYADVGLAEGRINFGAPVIAKYGIEGIPYFFVVDSSGQIVAKGNGRDPAVAKFLDGE